MKANGSRSEFLGWSTDQVAEKLTSSYDVVLMWLWLTWSDDVSRESSTCASITNVWDRRQGFRRRVRAHAVSDEDQVFVQHRSANDKADMAVRVANG